MRNHKQSSLFLSFKQSIDGSEGNYFGSKRYQINRKNKIEMKVVKFFI